MRQSPIIALERISRDTVLQGNKGHKFSPEIVHCPLLVRTVPYWSGLFFLPKICLAYQYLSFAIICKYAWFKKGKFDCTIFDLILSYWVLRKSCAHFFKFLTTHSIYTKDNFRHFLTLLSFSNEKHKNVQISSAQKIVRSYKQQVSRLEKSEIL